jgi:L-lysine exporter family protein LysE/ArgO
MVSGWFAPAAEGFALGLSLILAIGAQNAFVLRQGLRGEHVGAVVAVCAISDAALIALGVAGFGRLNAGLPWLAPALTWGGVAFLAAYGALALRRAWAGGAALDPAQAPPQPLGAVLATCLALTWLNPHVWLDTVVLLGSIGARHDTARPLFALGAMTASAVFFSALGFGARLLAPLLARPGAWRVLEAAIGAVMWALALRLATG